MIVVPASLKGKFFCGSKRIEMIDSMSIADAKLIQLEAPALGVKYLEDEKPKVKKKK